MLRGVLPAVMVCSNGLRRLVFLIIEGLAWASMILHYKLLWHAVMVQGSPCADSRRLRISMLIVGDESGLLISRSRGC